MTKTKNKIHPICRWHGGKFYLQKWVVSHFPENYNEIDSYIEPFAGAASVYLNKQKQSWEMINDLDYGTYCMWRTVQTQCANFIDVLSKIECSNLKTSDAFEYMFSEAKANKDSVKGEFATAVNQFTLRRLSRGGMMKDFSWSTRTRGGQPETINAWENGIKNLAKIEKRLKNTVIMNQNALELLKTYNRPNILWYLDSPYLSQTRVSTKIYDCELSDNDHIKMAELVNANQGKFIISGYPSPLYDELYKGWRVVTKDIKNHSSQVKVKPIKTECLWLNY